MNAMSSLPRLTQQESEKWYAPFYSLEQAAVDEDILLALSKGPMDPEEAVLGHNINAMLEPRSLAVKTGYCQLPGGACYVAVHHKLPGMTIAMYDRWNQWRLEADVDLRYKVWHPKAHIALGNSWICEDIGYGPFEAYFIRATDSVNLGLDGQRLASSRLKRIDGALSLKKDCYSAITSKPSSMIVCHFLYETRDGIEMHSRFWMGYTLGQKGLEPVLEKGQKIPLHHAYLLAVHNGEEMANMRRLIPHICKHDD